MIAKTKLLMAALIAAMGAVSPVIAAQPLTKVIMTTGSFSEREAAMYVAQDQGFFRRYGLELTFVQVRSGPVGMAAIASGETQLHEGSATAAVLSAAAEGLDLVFVAGMINKLIGNIMATPKIKSPADLKGKAIAVTSASGGSWMFTTLALEYWGLDAKRDGISFRILGDESGAKPSASQRICCGNSFGLHVLGAAHRPRLYQSCRFGEAADPLSEHRRADHTSLHERFARDRRGRSARHRRFVALHRSTGKQTGGAEEFNEGTQIAKSRTSHRRL
jgi:hypothetical protein